MELRHLRYFVAVAEELNYRKASERLHLSAPALSHQIMALEDELGFRLFDRDTGGVRLTDAGKAFLTGARLTLAQSQDAVLMGADAAAGNQGHLSVGYVGPVLMGFIPACLMAFHRRFPKVDVNLVEMPIQEQVAALKSGAIKLGFAICEVSKIPRGLCHTHIVNSPVRAVMARNHALAGLAEVPLADLAREPLLCHTFNKDSDSLHAELMRRIFAAHRLNTRPIRPIEGHEAFRAALEGGMGVSLIAEIGGFSRNQLLAVKPIKDDSDEPHVELQAIWRDGGSSQMVSSFVGLMQEIASRGTPRIGGS